MHRINTIEERPAHEDDPKALFGPDHRGVCGGAGHAASRSPLPAIEERAGEGAATTLPSDAVLPVAEGGGSDAAVGNAAEGLPYQPVPLSGVFLIRPSGSDVHVLDVADGSIANSTNVQLYRSNMTAGQRFAIEPVYVDGLPYCRVLVTIDGVQKALDRGGCRQRERHERADLRAERGRTRSFGR